jgi:hypothetical protein
MYLCLKLYIYTEKPKKMRKEEKVRIKNEKEHQTELPWGLQTLTVSTTKKYCDCQEESGRCNQESTVKYFHIVIYDYI